MKSRSKTKAITTGNNPSARKFQLKKQVVGVGSMFDTIEMGIQAVYDQELEHGHIWRKGQSYKDSHGQIKKLTLCCNLYQDPQPIHKVNIDPNDHRNGKTKRTGCMAHVNDTRVAGSSTDWYISTAVFDHNHGSEILPGGTAQHHPNENE